MYQKDLFLHQSVGHDIMPGLHILTIKLIK